MLQSLFPKVGWAWATRIMAFVMILLCTVGILLTRSRLSAKDRAKTAENYEGKSTSARGTDWKAMIPDPTVFLKQRGHILITAIGIFFIEWGLFTPVTYLSRYASSTGTTSVDFSYQLMAIFNAGSCLGRFGPGVVADHLGRFNTMIITLAMCLVASFALWLPADLISAAENEARLGLVIAFTVFFGIASGSNISLTPICVGQLCDTKEYGRYYATSYTLVSFGTLTGIPIAGSLISVTHDSPARAYWGVILFTGLCYVASIFCFTWVRVARVGWSLREIW